MVIITNNNSMFDIINVGKSGCCSVAVLERWVSKISALEEKKRHYGNILRRELNGLDDDFTVLKGYSQELSIRARGIRARKAA